MTAVPSSVNLRDLDALGLDSDDSDAKTEATPPTVVYLGTLLRERQLDFIVRAHALVVAAAAASPPRVRRQRLDARRRGTAAREAERLGIADRVTITGWLPMPEAWQHVRRAALCVSPYLPVPILRSTSPTKLIEYMALGKPVVANDHPEQAAVLAAERRRNRVRLERGGVRGRDGRAAGGPRAPRRDGRRQGDATSPSIARTGRWWSSSRAAIGNTSPSRQSRQSPAWSHASNRSAMHALVIALLLAILVVEYLIEAHGLLQPYAILIPELLSGIAMLVVLVRLMNGTRVSFDWRYGLFMVVLLFTIAFGFAVQDVPTGAMLAGVRVVPQVPAVLPAAGRAPLHGRGSCRCSSCCCSCSRSASRRRSRSISASSSSPTTMHTGDPVRRHVEDVGRLEPLHGRRDRRRRDPVLAWPPAASTAMLLLAAWLFLPTMINETRATMVLLPAALLVPVLLMPSKRHLDAAACCRWLRSAASRSRASSATYNYFIQFREYHSSFEESWSLDRLRYYFYTGAANQDAEYVGRFDSIEFALEHTTQDPVTFAFGLGAGNVSESFLPAFDGKYANYYLRLGVGQNAGHATPVGARLRRPALRSCSCSIS